MNQIPRRDWLPERARSCQECASLGYDASTLDGVTLVVTLVKLLLGVEDRTGDNTCRTCRTTRGIPQVKCTRSHIINPLLTKFVRSRRLDICNCNCNLFTHGAPRSSQELVYNMSVHSRIELEFGNVGF